MVLVPVESKSWLSQRDVRVKVVVFFAYAVTVLLTPPNAWRQWAALAGLLAVLLLASCVSLRTLAMRFSPLLPFIGLSAFGLLLGGSPEMFWQVTVKASLCVGIGAWLSLTTPFPELLAALRWFRMPALLTTSLSFLFRYLFMLVEEAQRMARAYQSRCPRKQRLRDAGIIGRLVGALLLRAYDRADRIYLAMLARGFDGEFRSLSAPKGGIADLATLVGFLVLLSAIFVLLR